MPQNLKTIQDMDKIFKARSIALVGASNDPSKFGYTTLDCLIRGGFEGPIYPVNPKGGQILGLKVYPSVSDLPDRIDLVVIIVPAKAVPEVLRQAAQKGAAGAVICSGGFREAGRADLEAEITAVAKEFGLRLMGPNIAGINYLPNRMCAMFFPVITTLGPLAVIGQSGTVTNALSEWAENEGFGISAAINLGNQVDLCESDYLDYFATDEHTKTIVMYLEGVRDGQRFLNSLKKAAFKKPVALYKAGRTIAGIRSAASHTGSLAASHEVFAAACRQAGAFSADDLETLYDAAKGLAAIKPPNGRRLLSISSSGGAGTLAADQIESWGLTMPVLPKELTEELKPHLSPLATLTNPVDLVSIAAEDCRKVALAADAAGLYDVILINFGDPVVGASEMVEDLAAQVKASLAVNYFAGGDEEKLGRVKMSRAGFPVFSSPGRAIQGIGAAVWRANWRRARQLD